MVKVNQDTCIGCGACAAICPSVFKMEGGKAKANGDAPCAKEAAQGCPVGAIEA